MASKQTTSTSSKTLNKPAKGKQPATLPMPTLKQARVLQAIAKAPQTRKQLHHQHGLPAKGWAALLGAHTKGAVQPGTMQGLGWVTQTGTGQPVAITADGKKALERYKKANGEVTKAKAK